MLDALRIQLDAYIGSIGQGRGDAGRPRSTERIKNQRALVRESPDERLKDSDRLLGRMKAIAAVHSGLHVVRERSGGVWSLEETKRIRQERSAPLMAGFKAWVDELSPGVPPKSALGKALGYTLSQWTKLSRFLEYPEAPAHNNRVENDIRPFAVGRRAWLFMDTQLGARASANLYSIVSTCRANGIEPLTYLTHLYEQLPLATTVADLEALLPWSVKPLLKASATSNI